jgi:hypothetical protein
MTHAVHSLHRPMALATVLECFFRLFHEAPDTCVAFIPSSKPEKWSHVMRFRCIPAFVAAISLLLTALSDCFASTTYQGGGWYAGSSWSGGTIPTLADDVIVPTGYTITLNSTTSNAQANTITLQGTARIVIADDSLEVDGGGNNPSSINAANAISLQHSSALLTLSGTQTWAGAGSVQLANVGARISISSGVTWTVTFNTVHGFGSVIGSGTFKLDNNASLEAESSGTLTLASLLSLDDTSRGNAWMANGGTLEFDNDAPNLVGGVGCWNGGTLDFNDDVTTTGLFTWAGVLDVADDVTFTYTSYSGECTNPGSGSGPFTVAGDFIDECP